MSAISELLREAPVYKKTILAVAFTAGVGASVYFAYRCATKSKSPVTGPSKPEKKPVRKPTAAAEEPSVEKEEHFFAKTEAVKIDLGKTASSPPKVEEPVRSSSPLRTEELSTSVTFEKISLAPNESDNFEHLTMSQVNPLESLPAREAEEIRTEEQAESLESFVQPEVESTTTLLNPPDIFESLSVSQTEQSISIISAGEDEQEETEDRGFEETEIQEQPSGSGDDVEAAFPSRDDVSELTTATVGVKLKDENDIVVVEPSSEESDSEKSEEEMEPSVEMASVPIEFDTARVSPVFGHQSYHRVDVEPEELVDFDPAKSHPASVGFKFDSDI